MNGANKYRYKKYNKEKETIISSMYEHEHAQVREIQEWYARKGRIE